jgi:hypothetical protein
MQPPAAFFIVPSASMRVLYVWAVLAHHRRRVVGFNVTANPTPEGATYQVGEAFPWDHAQSYSIRSA